LNARPPAPKAGFNPEAELKIKDFHSAIRFYKALKPKVLTQNDTKSVRWDGSRLMVWGLGESSQLNSLILQEAVALQHGFSERKKRLKAGCKHQRQRVLAVITVIIDRSPNPDSCTEYLFSEFYREFIRSEKTRPVGVIHFSGGGSFSEFTVVLHFPRTVSPARSCAQQRTASASSIRSRPVDEEYRGKNDLPAILLSAGELIAWQSRRRTEWNSAIRRCFVSPGA